MDKEINEKIMVKTTINENVKEVWEYWTKPEHITKWNRASDDWCTLFAENDLTAGGKFLYRMEAKDKSDGFDFTGTYSEVIPLKRIAYTLDDGRKVNITFIPTDNQTEIIETFEGEKLYSFEHQQQGWQSILDHFKEYTEISSR
ncbi:SRPBCC domain-containing protein [Alkalibacterium sp. f15]|uniref:SRPBCC domain-containing protein n=1 Tax=Alkalibacterium sp. f15 TaxID=3414029 RepID=UPI003BF82762